jgi:glycerophosphoryl diester phosphodiesterase
MHRLLPLLLIGSTLHLVACGPRDVDRVTLTGRAVLPADTFTDGPVVGRALPSAINGRHPPFASVPVQGFSSLVLEQGGMVLALQDNGFGTRVNSPDHPLRWYRLRLHLDFPPHQGGRVEVLGHQDLHDPDGRVGFPLRDGSPARVLTGADFDPESFVRLDDGTFWIGEEFGPYLLHAAPDGRLLGSPVPVPVPSSLREVSRGVAHLRSPDHPDLRSLEPTLAARRANLPASGGIEGLARTPRGDRLYVAVEKALLDDPEPLRRLILEFDPARGAFTGRHWLHRVDMVGVSIAALEAVTDDVLLLVERDAKEGAAAAFKRIYRVDLGRVAGDGFLDKTLVADLLDIADPDGFTVAEPGAVGLGPHYAFPYVTPECLAVVDNHTLLVACDNNYPFSAGRRPPSTPDDSEFVRLRLPSSLRVRER